MDEINRDMLGHVPVFWFLLSGYVIFIQVLVRRNNTIS